MTAHGCLPRSPEHAAAIGVYDHDAQGNTIVNVGNRQSRAVQSRHHPPLVFNDPNALMRDGDAAGQAVFEEVDRARETGNATLDFLPATAENAVGAGGIVRRAAASYQSPVDYGIGGLSGSLRRGASLIAAELPTRLYCVGHAGNAFDTHVHQAAPHARLLAYCGFRGMPNADSDGWRTPIPADGKHPGLTGRCWMT